MCTEGDTDRRLYCPSHAKNEALIDKLSYETPNVTDFVTSLGPTKCLLPLKVKSNISNDDLIKDHGHILLNLVNGMRLLKFDSLFICNLLDFVNFHQCNIDGFQ